MASTAPSAKAKGKVLLRPGFAKARAAAKVEALEAAKPETKPRSTRTSLSRRASSPPAPAADTARAVADPLASRRAARSSGLHASTAASQAREAALRQAFPARNQSPRREPPVVQAKAKMPARTRSARLSAPAAAQAFAPQRLETPEKNNQAVQALRRLVDLKEVICAEVQEPQDRKPALPTAQKGPQLPSAAMSDTPRSLQGSSVLVHSIASEDVFPPVSLDDAAGQIADAASTACSPSLYSRGAGGGGGSSTTDERMRQLVLENQALREAFGDTQKRLIELEDERQCFLDEGVYDIVNSICGQTGLSPKSGVTGLMGDADNDSASTKRTGEASTVTYHIGSSDPSAELLGLMGSPLSPLSLAQMAARKSEQDLRSAELSGENEKLRRELERTTKILEVLEQQKHLAEDKMLALEQEHAVLVRKLAEMQATGGHVPDAYSPGESSIEMVRQELEDISREAPQRSSHANKVDIDEASVLQMEAERPRPDFAVSLEFDGNTRQTPATTPSTPAERSEATHLPSAKSAKNEDLVAGGGAAPDGRPDDRALEPWELEDAW